MKTVKTREDKCVKEMKQQFDWEKYARIARKTVAEGCVLLRNENNALPIKKGECVSVFGRMQFHYVKSGTGSGGMVNAPYVKNILDGLRAKHAITVNEKLVAQYEEWIQQNPFDAGNGWGQEPWCQKEMQLTQQIVDQAAQDSDLAIVIIGRTAGEDRDNSAQEGSYLLNKDEELMLAQVCTTFTRVAVLLNVGNIIDMKWVEAYKPQAVLYTWQGGMEGGNGIADVLTGEVNPSGKLSDTIAEDITDYPSTACFGNLERNFYEEDIYVGYRYFETFAKESVSYPFGYGLSYTTFSYDVPVFSVKGKELSFVVKVKNTGEVAGKEVVQIYYCPPQGSLGKPLRNLIRFQKTETIEPAKEIELNISFAAREMASYDDSGATGHKSCWVLEAGSYGIYVGTDVRSASYIGEWMQEVVEVVEELTEVAAPVLTFERMKPIEGVDGSHTVGKEKTPLRTISLPKRIDENKPVDVKYSGDQGYKLVDVYEGKINMTEFLAQLSEDDLIHLTRGEGMCSPKVTAGTAAAFGGVTQRLIDYGIPTACCADGPSGIRMDCGNLAFSLPNGTLLACSFNTDLVEELYEMEALELRKNQIDTLLGPGMNIHRNPLNGRNFEYFSEDPYLTGKMATSELKSMHKYGVTGTIKHFACNNQEVKRHDADSVVSERALREIYLKGFEIAVKEGGAYSVMSTYGPLNGIWTAGNYDLLTTILRNEWNFDGIVMTDWWAKINEEQGEGTRENTIPMIRAQNDIYMVVSDALQNSGNDNTKEGILTGEINRAQLVRNASNICKVLMKLPVMDRFLNRNEDTWEVLNEPKSVQSITVQKEKVTLDKEVRLDIKDIITQKASSLQYSLKIPQKGKYRIRFQMCAKAGELAQLPVSVFMNNQLLQTITINGTGGEWIYREVEFEVFVAIDNFLKLYFGETGIEIGEILIQQIG